ncbi:formate/nitrite transporter family protein [Algihabitans albus]|uniref:formate/nitrite transporter family protein n=1 Tax=Algihabitans albus TaxID=2164067 RepID=UPI000E5C5A7F|nr:formate/nitrite transporter family protein [Algihabitans albus]
MSRPEFEEQEHDRIEDRRPLSGKETFEVVRRAGEEELTRPSISLAWSGLAAGLAIGFSVITEAAFMKYLPAEALWTPLIANMGYTVGFILVVLARFQLFTENTITPVMPICYAPTSQNLLALLRNWTVVFSANMVGAILFAIFVIHTAAVSEEIKNGVLELGRHAADGSFLKTVVQGIGAGFLIAALVWLLANSRGGELLIVFVVTYVIALAGFAHVIAGAVEVAALVLTEAMGVTRAFFGFVVPALLGNVVGGTVLFTLIAYSQVREELGQG